MCCHPTNGKLHKVLGTNEKNFLFWVLPFAESDGSVSERSVHCIEQRDGVNDELKKLTTYYLAASCYPRTPPNIY
jgi:hypothetical protein